METTFEPQIIYDAFDKYGFPVLRIDQFDRGDYAEIRAELNFPDFITVNQLQEITLKLNLIEENENINVKIVNIDLIHKTMRINIYINKEVEDDDELTEPIIVIKNEHNEAIKKEKKSELVNKKEQTEPTAKIEQVDHEIKEEQMESSIKKEKEYELPEEQTEPSIRSAKIRADIKKGQEEKEDQKNIIKEKKEEKKQE